MIHCEAVMRDADSRGDLLKKVERRCNEIEQVCTHSIVSVVPVRDRGHDFANIAYITWDDGLRVRRPGRR